MGSPLAGRQRTRMSAPALILALCLPLASEGAPASPAEVRWSPAGPPGIVEDVAIEPSAEGRLFSLTAAGVYRSDDHGATWQLLPGSPGTTVARALAVPPWEPTSVYAAGCGVRLGTDLGAGWYDAGRGLPADCAILGLKAGEAQFRFLAIGTSGLFLSGYDGGGLVWSRIGSDAFSDPVAAAMPGFPRFRIYAATGSAALFRSDDAGASWVQIGPTPESARVRGLRTQGSTFLTAGTDAGGFASVDSGSTWVPMSPQLHGFGVTDVISPPPGGAYAATDRGVFRLGQAGSGWQPFSAGLPEGVAIRKVLADPSGRFLVAQPLGVAGTFVLSYPTPELGAPSRPEDVLVGHRTAFSVSIDPPQPAIFELAFSSSDPAALSPFRFLVPAFVASAEVPLLARRASAAPVTVTVSAPLSLGGKSVSFSLSIRNPEPRIGGVYPAEVVAGGAGFTLALFGDFVSDSVLFWNGSPRPTNLDSRPVPCALSCPPPALLATISAEDIASPGVAQITVSNPAPGGGLSPPVLFPIRPSRVVLPRCPHCERPPAREVSPRRNLQ